MALTERLALQITADGAQAVRGINDVGRAADRQLGAAEGRFKQTGVAFASMGTRIAAAGVGAFYGLKQLSDASAALDQQVRTSGRVFGEASGEIDKFGATAAKSLGMSEEAFRLNANRLGSMLTNLGFAQDEASKVAIDMSTIATDLGAAFGTDTSQAIEAIGAAFRGERDPIEQFGISLKQADIDAKVAAMGLDTSTTSAKKHSEALASMALIQEQAGKTAGSFADSVKDGAGAMKQASAQWEDAKAKFGKAVTPAMAGFTKWAAGVVDEFTDIVTNQENARSSIVETIATNEKWGRSYEEATRYLATVRGEVQGLQKDAAEASSELVDFGDIGDRESKQMVGLAGSMTMTSSIMAGLAEAARQVSEERGISYEAAFKLVSGEKEVKDATEDTTEATKDQAKEVKTLAERWDDARKAVDDWRDSQLGSLNAEADYIESGQELMKQLREKGTGFDWVRNQINLQTEAGRENLRQSQEWADDAIAFAQSEAQRTGSLEAGRAKLQEVRDWFIRTQMGAGMSEVAAKAYADRLGLVPKTVETTWVAHGLSDIAMLLDRIAGRAREIIAGNSEWGGGGFLTGGYTSGGASGYRPPAISGAQAGAAAGAAAMANRSVVNVTVHGSVIAERDLADTVAKSLATREMALR